MPETKRDGNRDFSILRVNCKMNVRINMFDASRWPTSGNAKRAQSKWPNIVPRVAVFALAQASPSLLPTCPLIPIVLIPTKDAPFGHPRVNVRITPIIWCTVVKRVAIRAP
jgi:hypothetical protein